MKLDELIRATQGAHMALLGLEELEQDHLDKIREKYEELAAQGWAELLRGGLDTGTPEAPVDLGRP